MSAPTVISADSHVQEPPELYAERLPAMPSGCPRGSATGRRASSSATARAIR